MPALPRVATLVAAVAVAVLLGAPGASAEPAFGTAEVSAQGVAGSVTAVRVGAQPAFDRVVIDFSGGVTSYQVSYVDQITADGSGDPVPAQGAAFVQIALNGVTEPFPSGAQTPNLPGILQVVDAGLGFEGTVSYGLGTTKAAGFRAFTLADPPRLVVDVAHPDAPTTTAAPSSTSAAVPSATNSAVPISAGPIKAADSSDTTSTIVLFACAVVALGAIVVAVVLFGQRRKAHPH